MDYITVTLPVPAYVQQWAEHHFGRPVRLPHPSAENATLHDLLRLRPPGARDPAAGMQVAVTASALRSPLYYNWLPKPARIEAARMVDRLFLRAMWCDLLPVTALPRGRLNETIDAWCAEHGITLDNREAVRQRFYRLRRDFAAHGVPLKPLKKIKS